MADENMDVASEVAAGQIEPGSKNPFVSILLIVNALLMGAIAFFQFQSFQRDKNRADIRDVIKAEMTSIKNEDSLIEGGSNQVKDNGILLPLDAFTANLAQGDGPKRYIRLSAVLKFSNESKEAEFKARKPQIRDTIISILNSKRPEDLLKIEGKTFLKEEIKSSINSFLVDGNVLDIFYVAFQIN